MVTVVVGALVRDGRVLLAHRRPDKVAYPGVWDLPGGVREEGESELAALVRELREELGVEVDVDAVSHLCRVEARPVDEPVVLSAWLVREWDGTPVNRAPEEHLDIGWFGLDELPAPAHVDVRAALVRALRD
jgi:8-oxo-dGTP diphosphatase